MTLMYRSQKIVTLTVRVNERYSRYLLLMTTTVAMVIQKNGPGPKMERINTDSCS